MPYLQLIVLASVTGCGVAIWYPPEGSAANGTERLTLTVSAAAVRMYERAVFKAAGGKTPYKFSMVSGGGSVTYDGNFTGAAPAGVSVVRVTDADQKTADAAIIVEAR